MRRLLHLLYWQAQFDNRRPLQWLCGAAYLLVTGPLILGGYWLLHGRLGFRLTGSTYLSALTVAHAIGAAMFVSFRASRAADERATGFLAIVQMTDLPASALTAYRLFGILVSLFPLWLLRFPLYVVCYYLGNVRLSHFLVVEALLALVTLGTAAIAILCAQAARSSQAAMLVIGGALVVSQAIFFAPRLIMGLLRLSFGILPPGLDPLNEWALVLSQWSLAGRTWSPPLESGELLTVAPGLAIHLAASLLALWAAWRLTYVNVLPGDVESGHGQTVRAPRRVTGEALAWQAEHLHLKVRRLRLATHALTVVFLLAMIAATFTVPPLAAGVLAMVITARALTMAGGRAAACVFYEIRDQTLSTLALLPREPLEFYSCWKRGARRVSRLDYLTAAIGVPLVLWNLGDMAAGFLGMLLAMALVAPFAYLNSLCRFEWRVAWLALWMFPLGISLIVASFVVASLTTPWIGLLLFAILAPIYQWLILRQIPHYFQRSIERL